MLNLASFRYAKILSASGGPVERLETTTAAMLGRRLFLANAYLNSGLVIKSQAAVFGSCDGSGVDESPMVARFKAVSEAMERWAHAELCDSTRYGFDVDPSTNGLAAYPGLRRRQARANALLEAAERFNLLNWWEGRLPAVARATPWLGVGAVVIRSEAPGLTVIVHKQTSAGHAVYGHACDWDFDQACFKAAVEMERHEILIDRFALAHAGATKGQLPLAAHPIERRCLFFASAEGYQFFLAHVHVRVTGPRARPKMVYDGVVTGPWSRYADVWRVVYEPPSDHFLGLDEDYFYI